MSNTCPDDYAARIFVQVRAVTLRVLKTAATNGQRTAAKYSNMLSRRLPVTVMHICSTWGESRPPRTAASSGRRDQDRGSDPDGFTGLRAASHPIDHLAQRNAVLVPEFLELPEINLIGQVTQRVVSRPLVAQAAQSVSQPLPAIPHGYHPSPVVNLTPLRNGAGQAAALMG
jgi:hypothetical protein